jgi:hypothetical protein
MFDFNRIAGFNLDVGAGGTYYLRYDELNPPPLAEGTPTLGDGPLQLVPASLAEKEIGATHEFQPPQRFAADGEREEEPGFWGALGL